MKPAFKLLIPLLVIFSGTPDYAQDFTSSTNYYSAIKNFDLSGLWKGDYMQTDDGLKKDFPKPLGYIGNNFRRFYIHYNSIRKDPLNAYRYLVTGKTRVGNNISNFKGSILIAKAIRFIPSYTGFIQGQLECELAFQEDSTSTGGIIKGKLTTQFCIDKKRRVHYDAMDINSDGYENNQCIAIWTSYKKKESKKCNWGDYRIPESESLDGGAGEFIPNRKYINNGWQNYQDLSSFDEKIKKKALAEENRKWWE